MESFLNSLVNPFLPFRQKDSSGFRPDLQDSAYWMVRDPFGKKSIWKGVKCGVSPVITGLTPHLLGFHTLFIPKGTRTAPL
jgi:hypothetical protein